MHQDFQPAVYIFASRRNGTLYTGVTSDLLARIHQHRIGAVRGFTRKYDVKLLVWFEQHTTMHSAITREKRIKKWNRAWKLDRSRLTIPTGATSPKSSASRRSNPNSSFPRKREGSFTSLSSFPRKREPAKAHPNLHSSFPRKREPSKSRNASGSWQTAPAVFLRTLGSRFRGNDEVR